MRDIIDDLRSIAEQLALQHTDELPVDPTRIAESLGIGVAQGSGLSRFDRDAEPPVIWVTADLEPERQLWRAGPRSLRGLCSLGERQ